MGYVNEIDIESAKERFMSNESLYKRFLFQFPDKNMMEQLQEQLDAKNAEEAFKVAHTMKGVVGNLSLNRLMSVVEDVVEDLRAGNLPVSEKVESLKTVYAEAMAAIGEIQTQDIALF